MTGGRAKAILFILIIVLIAGAASAQMTRRHTEQTPDVEYLYPKSEEAVDLTGAKSITFKWRPLPIPSGGRLAYKFELFRDFSYDRLAVETLPPDATSIDIPAGLFEDGAIYAWQVKQRDKWTHNWSKTRLWSFSVIRKK